MYTPHVRYDSKDKYTLVTECWMRSGILMAVNLMIGEWGCKCVLWYIVCCEYWYLSATLHGATSCKAVHIQTIVRFTIPTALTVVWDMMTLQLEDAVVSKCRYVFVKLQVFASHETVIPKDHWFVNYKSFARNCKCLSVCVMRVFVWGVWVCVCGVCFRFQKYSMLSASITLKVIWNSTGVKFYCLLFRSKRRGNTAQVVENRRIQRRLSKWKWWILYRMIMSDLLHFWNSLFYIA